MDDMPIINAFEHMQVPLMILGPDGAILHCNRASCRLFGYDGNQLIGRPVSEVLPVDSVAYLNGYIEPPALDAISREMIGRSRGGDPIPMVADMTSWRDADGGLQHALVLRDVTGEKEASRLIRDELLRTKNAVEGARIGVFEYDPLTDKVIVSDIWRELLELKPTDAVDVQVEWRDRVHPDDIETALSPIRICMDGIGERASCEYRLRSKDESRWNWFQTNVSVAKRNEQGKVIRVIGAMSDISERKATESALRKSVAQFGSAFNNAAVAKVIFGLDGRWLGVNPALCDFLGYSKEVLLQTDFQSLTHPDDLNADLSKLELLQSGSIPSYQLEKRYIRADGAVVWGLLSVGLVRDANGNPDHFIAEIADVTERKRLSELKSEFVATVSHELRTPLTSVLASLNLLASMDSVTHSDEAQRLLFIAEENGKRLHSLVNDILDFEKFSARKMQLNLSKQYIVGLVEEAILTNLAAADKFGVKFKVDCPDRSLRGFVDPNRFQQVMTNLLSNAAKFSNKESQIDVAVEGRKKNIRVSVTNEGEGIPKAYRDRIFSPFTQAAMSSSRAQDGTGLGLNITKHIVEQSGGMIGFDSSEGGRTTFWFTVPVNEQS